MKCLLESDVGPLERKIFLIYRHFCKAEFSIQMDGVYATFLSEPDQIGIRQEITDAVAYKNVIKIFLCSQLGNGLLVIAEIDQDNLFVGFSEKTAQAVGVGIPDNKELAFGIGIVNTDDGMVAVQKNGILIGFLKPIPIEYTVVETF